MIFQVDDQWEVLDPVIKQLIGAGLHRYPAVKVSLNLNLFHLDVLCSVMGEDVEIWERYIFALITDVIGVISHNTFKKVKISFQSASTHNEDDEYCISTITEIIEDSDDDGKSYIFKCKNGKTYFDSFNTKIEMASSKAKTIYANYG